MLRGAATSVRNSQDGVCAVQTAGKADGVCVAGGATELQHKKLPDRKLPSSSRYFILQLPEGDWIRW